MNSIQKESILIVDDVPTNIRFLHDLLHRFDYRVLIAKSGESALEKVNSARPDLILLDVMMPGMDGFETCRRLKANPETRDIPVVFLSALSDSVDKVNGLSLGAVDYITKPIDQNEVLARINVHLELRRTQLKLIQTEKMSALGQLVAGIAHEINNPINFIQGNLPHTQRYVTGLLQMLRLYEQLQKQTQGQLDPEIQRCAEEIDWQFLQEDLPHLLQSMQSGANRIQSIVRSLQNFSRLDEASYKSVDLHESLDSILLLLNSRLQPKPHRLAIDISKHYGHLPLVECYAGSVNQVLMNMIVNAIDAIDARAEFLKPHSAAAKAFLPKLTIRTEAPDDQSHVLIWIEDNGVGMTETTKMRMFDPFFTTKPVGQGTGLGLSVSRQIIIEQHQGWIECQSKLNHGSKFMIQLPIQHQPGPPVSAQLVTESHF